MSQTNQARKRTCADADIGGDDDQSVGTPRMGRPLNQREARTKPTRPAPPAEHVLPPPPPSAESAESTRDPPPTPQNEDHDVVSLATLSTATTPPHRSNATTERTRMRTRPPASYETGASSPQEREWGVGVYSNAEEAQDTDRVGV